MNSYLPSFCLETVFPDFLNHDPSKKTFSIYIFFFMLSITSRVLPISMDLKIVESTNLNSKMIHPNLSGIYVLSMSKTQRQNALLRL